MGRDDRRIRRKKEIKNLLFRVARHAARRQRAGDRRAGVSDRGASSGKRLASRARRTASARGGLAVDVGV